MALVDPNIAMSFRAPEIKPRNALAEFAQMQQIVGGQRQAEVAELQLDALRQEREALRGIQEAIVAKGGPPDLGAAADAMIRTGRPEYLAKGMQIRQMVANQNAWSEYQKQFLSPETAAPAPSAEGAPANVLAPAAAATPPVNALAAPDIRSLENRYRMVAGLDTPGAKAEAKLLEQQIAEARTSARPTTDQRMMQILGLPSTPQGYAQFKSLSSQPEVMRLAQELGAMAPNDPMRKFYQDRLTKLTTHAPSTKVDVKVSTGKRYGETFGAQIAERDANMLDAARQAPTLAADANRIIELASNPNVFTGSLAQVKLNVARALGVAGADTNEVVANTEQLIAAAGQSTLNAIKGAGLGTGQGFTDKDLAFLRDIAGGKITFTKETLSELARLQYKVAEKAAGAWGSRVKEIPKEALEGTGISTAPITLPPLSRPGGPPKAVGQIPGQAPAAKTVVRTGTLDGRKVAEYSDGTVGYAD